MRTVAPLLIAMFLGGCAGSSGSGAHGGAQMPNSGDSGGSATRPLAAAAGDSVLCIGANLTDAQLLGWLANHGYLEGEPWIKLFLEPPMTGPRAGVDTTRYVDFALALAERVVRIDTYADGTQEVVPFSAWGADSQRAFAEREWPCLIFNLCDPGTCLCGQARWSFAAEVP